MRKAVLIHLMYSPPKYLYISASLSRSWTASLSFRQNAITEIIKHLSDLNCTVIRQHSMTGTATRASTALYPGFSSHFYSESFPYPDFPWGPVYDAIKTVNQRQELPNTWATHRTIKYHLIARWHCVSGLEFWSSNIIHAPFFRDEVMITADKTN